MKPITLGSIFRDIVLPTLAILLTAYNVHSFQTQRKDSFNDILYTQQIEAATDIADKASIYQGELLRLLRLEPARLSASAMTTQTKKVVAAARVFSRTYTKAAPILPDGMLLEVTRFHTLANRLHGPYLKGIPSARTLELLRQNEPSLIQAYAKIFQRLRHELGVDTLNDESKQLFEKLQTGKAEPVG